MKKKLLTVALVVACTFPLMAQKMIEKSFPLRQDQKVILELKFAENIKIATWNKKELLFKAEVNINNGQLNDAHTIAISNEADKLKIQTNFDKEILKKSQPGDCEENNHSFNTNENGKGYSVCSEINYTIFVPADTDLKVETISGNIEMAQITGPVEAKSISGYVDLKGSETRKADIYLKSISGDVYSDLEIKFSNRQENPIVGYELKGKLNGGGPIVRLESISGDVYLRKVN